LTAAIPQSALARLGMPDPYSLSDWRVTPATADLRSSLVRAVGSKDYADDMTWLRLWQWYSGQHAALLDELYREKFPALSAEARQKIRDEYLPALRHLVDMTCVTCQRPPQLTLTDADHAEDIPRDDRRVAAFHRMLQRSDIMARLQLAERLRFLHRGVMLYPAWRLGSLELDIVMLHTALVDESAVSPRRLDWAPAVFVQNQYPNSVNTSRETTYTAWTRETDGSGEVVRWGSYQCAADGAVRPNPLFANNTNGYGFHPLLVWHEDPAVDRVFPRVDETLEGYQRQTVVKWTQFAMDEAFGARGRTYTISDNPGQHDLPASPDAVWKMKGRPDDLQIGTLAANVSMPDLLTALVGYGKINFVFRNLPAGVFDLRQPAIQTGAALHEAKADMQDMRIGRAVGMYRDLQRLVEACIRVWDYWSKPADRVGPDVGVRVSFWAPALNAAVSAASAQSQAQADEFAYRSGRRSAWRDILREQDIDPEMARPDQIDVAKKAALSNAQFYLDTQRTREEREAAQGRDQDV